MKSLKKTFVTVAMAAFLIISSTLISCTTEYNPEAATEEPGENPIVLSVAIPQNSSCVNLYRREVTKNGSSYTPVNEDWEHIAGEGFDSNSPDYASNRTKSFKDLYEVKKDSWYEYMAVYEYEGSDPTETQIGYHKSGYNGAEFPSFNAQMTWNQDTKTLSIADSSAVEWKNNENNSPELDWWIEYAYNYNRIRCSFSENRHSETIPNDQYNERFHSGKNILTDVIFNFKLSGDDFFWYSKNYDLSRLDYTKIVGSITRPIVVPPADNVGINLYVTTPGEVQQTHIFRKLHSDPESAYREIGFCNGNYGEKHFTDYYYESGKSYDYKAVFTLFDWTSKLDMDLGTVTTTYAGWTEPSFDTAPVMVWDISEETPLAVTNSPTLTVPDGAASKWGNYTWELTFSYNCNGNEAFWPAYVYNNENHLADTGMNGLENWKGILSSDSNKNNMTECLIRINYEDEDANKISQTIALYQNKYGYEKGTVPTWAVEKLQK